MLRQTQAAAHRLGTIAVDLGHAMDTNRITTEKLTEIQAKTDVTADSRKEEGSS